MKRFLLTIASIFIILHSVFSQLKGNTDNGILFHGLAMDASTFSPISNSQIMINRVFSSVTGLDGTFAFYVNRNDTVVFKSLGYKSAVLFVSDTLIGGDYITGIYMNSDTLSIGEVIIVPRLTNIKSEIMNARSITPVTMENARYNVAVSAYQGRNSQNQMGDPLGNYAYLKQKQRVDAYEKGGIPSNMIVGFNALLLIPAAAGYLLTNSPPEKSAPLKQQLTGQELDQIHKKYMETKRQRR